MRLASILRSSFLIALVGSLSVASMGCGGSGAAMRFQPFPGDRMVTSRRADSLARTFEQTFPCAEGDTIDIRGMAAQVYAVSGCNGRADYMLSCRPGAYGQICSWEMVASLAAQAAVDMNCGAEYIEYEDAGNMMRRATGCGFAAVYVQRCSGGGCGWALNSRVESTGGAAGGTGAYTY